MTKKYTSKDIQVLSDRDHVRLRTNLYLGNTEEVNYTIPIFIDNSIRFESVKFVPAVFKAVGEVLDNSVDEFSHIQIPYKVLKIEANPLIGEYTISDNGRGVPIDKHETGRHTPEVVFGSLRSGRNFKDREVGVIGQNGVGSSCVNYCSSSFYVDIKRDGKRYRQEFIDGCDEILPPDIQKYTGTETGTTISFQLDDNIFKNVNLPDVLMHNRAIEIAATNPLLTVEYNKRKYRFNKGFDDIIKRISNDYFKFTADNMEFYAIFDIDLNSEEAVCTWVNSSYLFEGGICNTQFTNAFYDRVLDQLQSQAKKTKSTVTREDIRTNLLIIGNIKINNPSYDSQAKTKLISPNLRKEFDAILDDQWQAFAKKHKEWLAVVLERAVERHHKSANAKAVKDHQKTLKKKVPGLLDANGKDRSKCRLFITEGLSAAGNIIEVRDPATMGSFPLTGKINNTYGNTVAEILKMPKISNLFTAIGLIPGHTAELANMRFGDIVIATDADVDGGDIFSLLVNMLYQFWPELFNPKVPVPRVYRLVAPNIILIKGKNRLYFPSKETYEKSKQDSSWEVRYIKGLGGLEKIDWQNILADKKSFLPIVYDDNLKQTFELLFGPDADERKKWLQN
jgi:DNA gyrase/topoisomerase IV subunit B